MNNIIFTSQENVFSLTQSYMTHFSISQFVITGNLAQNFNDFLIRDYPINNGNPCLGIH